MYSSEKEIWITKTSFWYPECVQFYSNRISFAYMGDFNCVQLGLVPILAIGIPHCKTCTVVSTAAWMSSKEHTADTD